MTIMVHQQPSGAHTHEQEPSSFSEAVQDSQQLMGQLSPLVAELKDMIERLERLAELGEDDDPRP